MDQKDGNAERPRKKLDCEGFLNDTNFWTTDVAERLAKDSSTAEFGLTDKHWEVILFVRDFYLKYDRGPESVKVARHCGITMEEMCKLFPCGFLKEAYKIAGLPNPPGCI
jgi:TusE/DsrC/DsvC family sulfur relay protein